jgi:hypothetical protein
VLSAVKVAVATPPQSPAPIGTLDGKATIGTVPAESAPAPSPARGASVKVDGVPHAASAATHVHRSVQRRIGPPVRSVARAPRVS